MDLPDQVTIVFDYEHMRNIQLLRNKLEIIDKKQALYVLEYLTGRYEKAEILRFANTPVRRLIGLSVYCYDAQIRDRALKCVRLYFVGSRPSSEVLKKYFKNIGCSKIVEITHSTQYVLVEFVDLYSSMKACVQLTHVIAGEEAQIRRHNLEGFVVPETRINMVPAPRVDSLSLLRQRLANIDPHNGTHNFILIRDTYPQAFITELATSRCRTVH